MKQINMIRCVYWKILCQICLETLYITAPNTYSADKSIYHPVHMKLSNRFEPIPIALAVTVNTSKTNLRINRNVDALATWNHHGFNCFLFIPPLIIIWFSSSIFNLHLLKNYDFRTFYRFRIGQQIHEIYNFKDKI